MCNVVVAGCDSVIVEAHLQMNNNNKITHEQQQQQKDQSTYISYSFPIQFSRMQLRRQITLKCFHMVCHHVGQMYPHRGI